MIEHFRSLCLLMEGIYCFLKDMLELQKERQNEGMALPEGSGGQHPGTVDT